MGELGEEDAESLLDLLKRDKEEEDVRWCPSSMKGTRVGLTVTRCRENLSSGENRAVGGQVSTGGVSLPVPHARDVVLSKDTRTDQGVPTWQLDQ